MTEYNVKDLMDEMTEQYLDGFSIKDLENLVADMFYDSLKQMDIKELLYTADSLGVDISEYEEKENAA